MPKHKPFTCVLCECSSAGSEVQRDKRERDLCTWCVAELECTSRRWCRGCKTVKAAALFARWRCKACINAYSRARYAANPEARAKSNAKVAAWKKANPERAAAVRGRAPSQQPAARRAKMQNDPAYAERQRASVRAWQARNRERIRENTRQYKLRKKLEVLRQIRGAR